MSKRFIWNFEIKPNSSIQLPKDIEDPSEEKRWEARFFWSKDELIFLNGLDDSFLELSRYRFKHRSDTYLILPNRQYNFKIRRDALLYKPCLERTPHALAYGKKITLEHSTPIEFPEDPDLKSNVMLAKINREAQSFHLEKEAVIYKFPTTPKLTLEFARIMIKNQIYFSVSIESRVLAWVEYLSRRLLDNKTCCDYVTFLKSTNL
ncbi:hypothetical protein [Legionella impletisoli]|uniref:Uncharacterized protein n=1 Tax=Legionella impletisoli TaxID=343510 RepID=A0A917NE65_9GAMM|nr:hypothetical protein [Legionella impletisoli]GGI93412.1 hypothetical protein GCM10007966_22490 [Legionella impletisoli]